jgi:hypothetical protein
MPTSLLPHPLSDGGGGGDMGEAGREVTVMPVRTGDRQKSRGDDRRLEMVATSGDDKRRVMPPRKRCGGDKEVAMVVVTMVE